MIYITGDTHIPIDINKLNNKNFPEQKDMTKDDYLIICGDFGLLWDYRGWNKEEKYWKKWLNDKPFTTLFVDGNHENFDRLNSYPVQMWNGGKIHKISDSIFHLMRGQVFDIDKTSIFTFGGATSIDRGLITGTENVDRGVCWWDAELPTLAEMDEGRASLDKANWKVDYVITHCLPSYDLEGMKRQFGSIRLDYLNMYLNDIRSQLNFKHWYCGHYHLDVEANYKTTILYNDIRRLEC